MTIPKSKCDCCRYWSGRSCMVTPNSTYCREAADEYHKYLTNKKQVQPQKSLRPWDKNR